MNDKIELPGEPQTKHISLLLISDGLKQVEQNLQQQEENIKKLSEQISTLQNMQLLLSLKKACCKSLKRKSMN